MMKKGFWRILSNFIPLNVVEISIFLFPVTFKISPLAVLTFDLLHDFSSFSEVLELVTCFDAPLSMYYSSDDDCWRSARWSSTILTIGSGSES